MARFSGTEGNDFIVGTDEDDLILGRGGNDELRGGGGNDTLLGGEGDDILVGDEFFQGPGDDLLSGGEGNDTLGYVGGGNDTLIGGEGNDFFEVWVSGAAEHLVISGGDGVDSMQYVGGAATVDLGAGTLTTTRQGEPLSMSLHSIENFRAPIDGDVHVTGSAAANFIETGNGNDTLIGGGGRDTLWGSADDDLYILNSVGEADAPFIIFEKYTVEIQGFDENDRIALDSGAMTDLGTAGAFSVDDERFYAAAGATGGAEDDDRVIYDTAAGRLYYDADGSGEGEAQLIATLSTPGNDLAAGDITVI